jgi:hypothetical protein
MKTLTTTTLSALKPGVMDFQHAHRSEIRHRQTLRNAILISSSWTVCAETCQIAAPISNAKKKFNTNSILLQMS